jgi:hypothetical protein
MTDLPQETGHERVDAALAGLHRLGTLPVGEHVAVFEEIHAGLEQTLASAENTDDADRRL